VLDTQQATIGVDGGTIQSATVTDAPSIEIPANALGGPATVTLEVLDADPAPPANPQVQLIGKSVRLQVSGSEVKDGAKIILHMHTIPLAGKTVVRGYIKDNVWIVDKAGESPSELTGEITIPATSLGVSRTRGNFWDSLGKATVGFFAIPKIQLTGAVPMDVWRFDYNQGTNTGVWVRDNGTGSFTAGKIALLVHGFFAGTHTDFSDLAKHISSAQTVGNDSRDAYKVYAVEYPTGYGIGKLGEKLASIINSRTSIGVKIDLLAHSMGGLVARSAIENYGADIHVAKLVTMSTPHIGQTTSFLFSALVNSKPIFVAGGISNPWVPEFDDLSVDSPFLDHLNNGVQVDCRYYSAVGIDANKPEPYKLGGLNISWISNSLLMLPNDGMVEEVSSGCPLGGECAHFDKMEFSLNHDYIKRDSTVFQQIDNWLGIGNTGDVNVQVDDNPNGDTGDVNVEIDTKPGDDTGDVNVEIDSRRGSTPSRRIF